MYTRKEYIKEYSESIKRIWVIDFLEDRIQDLYFAFIGYEKAFDKIKHKVLIDCLKRKRLDRNANNIVIYLYWNQQPVVALLGNSTDAQQLNKGIR